MAALSPLKIAPSGEIQRMQTGDSVSNNLLSFVYLLQNLQTNVKIWNGTATTTGGVATFFPTSNNTAGGTAIFTTIFALQATSINNTRTVTAVGMCEIKAVAAGNQTITVNCVTGNTVVLGGNTTSFAANGRTVYLTIIGI